MEKVLQSFEEVISRANQRGKFPIEAKLVMRGRIDYAVQKGDLTQIEARRLDAQLGVDFTQTYRDAFEIAAAGDDED